MDLQLEMLLSDYVLGSAQLGVIRDYVERVDWDSPLIPEPDRVLLLTIEALVIGINEGFNDEADLRDYIWRNVPLLAPQLRSSPIVISTGSANRPITHEILDPQDVVRSESERPRHEDLLRL